jgi:hypothetical protein
MNISKIKLQRSAERRRAKWLEMGDNLTSNIEVEDMIWSAWKHAAA